jgi:hypothetical protein
MSEVEALKEFLAQQEDAPRLHINGNDYPTALVTVDFGQPLRGVSISTERGNELSSLMKAAAKKLTRRRGAIRVNYDNHHGVFWASISS